MPQELPRLAGISSFGAGGANAHVIVEELVEEAPARDEAGPFLLVLSARKEASLRAMAGRLLSDPTTLAGVILCTIIVAGALLAPWLAPRDLLEHACLRGQFAGGRAVGSGRCIDLLPAISRCHRDGVAW